MKYTAPLFFWFFLIGFLWGCSPISQEETSVYDSIQEVDPLIEDVIIHESFQEDVLSRETLDEEEGWFTVTMVRVKDRHTDVRQRPQIVEFRQGTDGYFSPYLILGHSCVIPKTLLVTAILDYEQIKFELDGEMGLLHEVTVPARTEIELPFSVNIDGSGAHDLQIIAFIDPYDVPLQDTTRLNPYGNSAGFRTVVIVAEDETPAKTLSSVIEGKPSPSEVTFTPAMLFATFSESQNTHPTTFGRQLLTTEAPPGKPYRFQLLMNNREDVAETYVLIPFLNYHQCQIQESRVLVAELEQGHEAIIDIDLMLPEERGVNQFHVIWFFDPYCSVLQEEAYAPFVFSSPRLLVDSR